MQVEDSTPEQITPSSEIKQSLRPKKKPKYRFDDDDEAAPSAEAESSDEAADDSDEDPDAVVAEEEEKQDLKDEKRGRKRKLTQPAEAVEAIEAQADHEDVDPGYPATMEGPYGLINMKELGERMFEKEKARSTAVKLGMEILFSQEEILTGACKGRGGMNQDYAVWDPDKLSALYSLFCEWSSRKGHPQPSEKYFCQICINMKTNKRKSLQLTEQP